MQRLGFHGFALLLGASSSIKQRGSYFESQGNRRHSSDGSYPEPRCTLVPSGTKELMQRLGSHGTALLLVASFTIKQRGSYSASQGNRRHSSDGS